MTPDEREAVVDYARQRQSLGDLLAWSIDEQADRAIFFASTSAQDQDFPTRIGSVKIVLTWLPEPEELHTQRVFPTAGCRTGNEPHRETYPYARS